MKKTIIFLGMMVALMLVMPLSVCAANFVDNGSGVYVSDDDISMGKYGTILAGDASWEYENEANGTKIWTFTFSTDYTYIYFYLIPEGLTIDSIDVNNRDGFVSISQTKLSDGTQPVLIQSANTSSTTLTVTVITTDDDGAEDCRLDISPQNLTCSTTLNGLYFDDNGNNITAAEYEELCGNTTSSSDLNDVPNSETGSVVPYLAIGGGIVAVIVVYLISRKSNKVYKI